MFLYYYFIYDITNVFQMNSMFIHIVLLVLCVWEERLSP